MMPFLPRVATACALLLPMMLLYSRAGAEIAIGIIDAAFLWRSWRRADWSWCRRTWWRASLPYWAWLAICGGVALAAGAPRGGNALVQALLIGRFLLLAAALGEWVLIPARTRHWLWIMFAAAAAWLAIECWQQYLFGTNIIGAPRYMDGALTGPFLHPRAGPALLLLFFPTLLPPVAALMDRARPAWWPRLAAILLVLFAVTTMVLIGQRMPTLLMVFGLLVTGLVLPRLRLVLYGALAAGAMVLAATPIISPPTFAKLYVRFLEQMAHFPTSSYGLLYGRALAIAEAHPVFGMGMDSFRQVCADPHLFVAALPGAPADGGGVQGCNLHPHNYYFEAAASAGLPGLVLFSLMTVVWLRALGRRLSGATAARIGLFVTVLLAVWPLGSTSAFFSVPNVGWLFLSLGWGLAEAGAQGPSAK